jgi:hypothetical protein
MYGTMHAMGCAPPPKGGAPAQWVNAKRTVFSHGRKRAVYRNSVTREIRVKLMVPSPSGHKQACYVPVTQNR